MLVSLGETVCEVLRVAEPGWLAQAD